MKNFSPRLAFLSGFGLALLLLSLFLLASFLVASASTQRYLDWVGPWNQARAKAHVVSDECERAAIKALWEPLGVKEMHLMLHEHRQYRSKWVQGGSRFDSLILQEEAKRQECLLSAMESNPRPDAWLWSRFMQSRAVSSLMMSVASADMAAHWVAIHASQLPRAKALHSRHIDSTQAVLSGIKEIRAAIPGWLHHGSDWPVFLAESLQEIRLTEAYLSASPP